MFFTLVLGCGISAGQNSLLNGLYLVDELEIDSTEHVYADSNKTIIHYNSAFIEGEGIDYAPISIWINDYVPFDLAKMPVTKDQTDKKKLLQLTLTDKAAEKLKEFSSKNLMKYVVIVVNGEALTVHKIKEPITSGMLQITRCNDNACEQLFEVLKSNVRN
jgi:hypothetical protein